MVLNPRTEKAEKPKTAFYKISLPWFVAIRKKEGSLALWVHFPKAITPELDLISHWFVSKAFTEL